jgi:phosphoribosyl 1,2-cyclic phosphate phosphodiesterase
VVESNRGTRVLIDTPPELRLQLIASGIDRIDAVMFTHDHADHIHGIDDLRAITIRRSAPLPVYGPPATLDEITRRFRYIFDETIRAQPGTSKPEANAHPIEAGQKFSIADLEITPVRVPHGKMDVFGYRMNHVGYVTDAKLLPDDAINILRGVKVLVINGLFRTEHPTHLSIPEAIRVAGEIGAERTYLTHLTHDNFHADLEAELPRGISPAFDGLTVRID